MNSRQQTKTLHFTRFINDETNDVIRKNGYHEDTVFNFIDNYRSEHPKECAAYDRFFEKGYPDWRDFIVRFAGYTLIDQGDFKYHQAENRHIITASEKPYTMYWDYVREPKSTHLEVFSRLLYDEKTDSIVEAPRDKISVAEKQLHTSKLAEEGVKGISEWYNGNPVSAVAKGIQDAEKAKERAEEERWRRRMEAETKKQLFSERASDVGRVYYTRCNNALRLLKTTEDESVPFPGVAVPHPYKFSYDRAAKDGLTVENLKDVDRYATWPIDRKTGELIGSGNYENGEPFGADVNKLLEENGLPLRIDPNAHYKIDEAGKAVIYENGVAIDMDREKSNMREWVGGLKRCNVYCGDTFFSLALEERTGNGAEGTIKILDIDLKGKPLASFRILADDAAGITNTPVHLVLAPDKKVRLARTPKDEKAPSTMTLEEFLKQPEIIAMIRETDGHIKGIAKYEYERDFLKIDRYINSKLNPTIVNPAKKVGGAPR